MNPNIKNLLTLFFCLLSINAISQTKNFRPPALLMQSLTH